MKRPLRVAHVTTVDLSLRFLLFDQLRRLRDEGYEVTGISAPGEWTSELEAEGIRHIAWSEAHRGWTPLGDLAALRSLLTIFRRERFDIVHTHNPKPGVLGRVAARAARVPIVVNTVHGLYAMPDDRLAKRMAVLAAERFAGSFSDLELYQSSEDLAWARRIKLVASSKMHLLGNGVDVRTFSPETVTSQRRKELRAALGIPRDATVIGVIGRLVAEKGYRELFAAADVVRSARPHAVFLAVGGREPDKWDALTDEEITAAGRNVTFAGWRDDVRDALAAMDVFVLPSWREGLPRSAIEAAAMGKPMILTDIRGCREVARHEMEALLIPPRDAKALADAILRLIDDDGLRAQLGRAARARAIGTFDEVRVTETVVRHYQALLDGRSGRASRRGRPPVDAVTESIVETSAS